MRPQKPTLPAKPEHKRRPGPVGPTDRKIDPETARLHNEYLRQWRQEIASWWRVEREYIARPTF